MAAMREGVLMGMFDWYRPVEALRCPLDGHTLDEWQGKDGPCGLLVWTDGKKYATDDWVDETVRLSASDLERFTLPPTFTIYSCDCPMHWPILATCVTVDGIWCSTQIYQPSERGQNRSLLGPQTYDRVAREGEAAPLKEFILVDLTTQMPYLPLSARAWPRERLFAWLRVWGEVQMFEWTQSNSSDDTYTFRSWVGLTTTFVLTQDGRMFIPSTSIYAWPEHTP